MSDTDDENVNDDDDDVMMVENNNDDEEEEENEEETTWELSELPKKERDIIDKFHHGKMANGLMTQDNYHGKCPFCGRTDGDIGELVGRVLRPIRHQPLIFHELCLMMSNNNLQQKSVDGPLIGFSLLNVYRVFEQAKKALCVYCKKFGATVVCAAHDCYAQFHLPCGRQNETFHIFKDVFKTYCKRHYPNPPKVISTNYPFGKHLEIATTLCTLCMTERVPMKAATAKVVRTTCCTRIDNITKEKCECYRYYHYQCVQRQALMAGQYQLKCPYLASFDKHDASAENHQRRYQQQLEDQGIYIPIRDAQWEQDGSQDHMNAPTLRCILDEDCLCPINGTLGREYNAQSTIDDVRPKWELLICSQCGSCSVHRFCAGKPWSIEGDDVAEPAWNCSACNI